MLYFIFLYSSWDSHSKYTGVLCHSLLLWITFCQNSPLWPVGWPYMAWLIASLSSVSPFAITKQWSLKGNTGDGEGQGGLACWRPWGSQRVGHDCATEQQRCYILDFPGGSDGKESAYNAEDPDSSLGQEYPLEQSMATHSSILAWRIQWTEEPSRLQLTGSQRVKHNWVTNFTQVIF